VIPSNASGVQLSGIYAKFGFIYFKQIIISGYDGLIVYSIHLSGFILDLFSPK